MYHFEANFKLHQSFKMENVIASPVREFSEKASKCLLEYETLYNNSRLSMNEEDYNQFSRLLLDDSASDADDEITDTSYEELNSSTEVYKPRNVYSITDGNKPFTLIIKKQQSSNNIDVSYKSREAHVIVNGGISDEFPLHNFEHVNTLETVAFDDVSAKEKIQNNETQYKPPECVEGMSTERKTFPLQDFNRFCDVTNKVLQKLSDPAISGYEANCESEDEVGNSLRMLTYNGSKVEGLEDRLTNQHNDSGFHQKHSMVQQDNIGEIKSSISNMESAVLSILDQSCTLKVNKLANKDIYSVNEYNDIEINKNLNEYDSGMELFPKNSCSLDYANNQVLSAHSLQNDDACLADNHLPANYLTCNKMKNDADVHLDNRETNSAVSDVGNAVEGGEHSIKDNEVTENYKNGKESYVSLSKTLEIIENECEMPSQVVHNAPVEMAVENEITSDAVHESLSEEANKHGVFSLDVTENSSKPIQTYLHCESAEGLQMHEFDHSEEHTEQRTVVERSEAEKRVLDTNFVNNCAIDHAILSPQKSGDEKIKQTEITSPISITLGEEENIKQTEIVNPINITLVEEENKILESSTDKYQSEEGTSFYDISNMSPAAVRKEDGAEILEPLVKSNVISKSETKGRDDRTFPADSFADDAMDCTYNDSSSCLDRSPLLFSSDEENYYYIEDSVAEDASKCYEPENQTQQERRKLRRLQRALAGVPPPPSVTIPQLDVSEILKLIKENQKLMKCDGSIEEKEGSPDGKELKRPLTLFCTEEVKNLPWPEAKSCNFYGVQYNNGQLSEELEALYERLRDRYVGCETLSSCNVWFPGISTKAIEKRMKRRNIGQSPGRRLSHLAKRRQVFSSANLLPSVAGSLPSAAARRGCNRLIMVEVKKGDHRTKAKGQPVKKAALNVNNKLQQTKRALFKSPPSGRKKGSSASKNKSSSKKIKREVDRSKVYNSKRALWPSSRMSENTVPDSNSSRQLKRQREESEDEGKHYKFPRQLLFGERDREKESNNPKVLHTNSSNGQILSQQHKKKLLWAVAETLRTKGVSMNHPSFRTLASSLARKVCSSLPDMSKKREGRTSEFMLQISKEHVDNILKTTALQDKSGLIKV